MPSALASLQALPPPLISFGGERTHVGNLVYTKMGLLGLFFWLLWFDFCWTALESVGGPIFQFRLKNDLNMDSALYAIFLGSIPNLANFVLNPIISISSDRHRGPRGRRVPYLLYAAPVVCVCLALLGFGNDIGEWLQASVLTTWTLTEVTIWTFVALLMLFTVFNMFLGTTFYYLFNDVVPEAHFVKFMAYMRVVGGIFGMIYGWYIFGLSNKFAPLNIDLPFFQYHNDHFWYPKLILVGASVFYLFAGTLSMLKIKEPSYPPPPPLARGTGFFERLGSTVSTITKECFSHKFYIIIFIATVVEFFGYGMSPFMNPMRVDMGMDLDMLGKIGVGTTFIALVLNLALANYGDRFRPLPLYLFSLVLSVLVYPIYLLFLIPGLSSTTYLWIALVSGYIHVPISFVMNMALSPLYMTLLPRERYGQFSAALSMLRALLAGVIGSALAGLIMRSMEHAWGEYALRMSFVWAGIGQVGMLFCYYLLYREWIRLGGKHGFKPPKVGPVSADEAALEKAGA